MKDQLLESTNQNVLHNFVATCSQATMVVVMVVAMVVVIMGVVMFPIIMVVVIVMFPLAMLNPESFPWFEHLPTTNFLELTAKCNGFLHVRPRLTDLYGRNKTLAMALRTVRVNRINLPKSQNWLLPRIGRHHGASCRGC